MANKDKDAPSFGWAGREDHGPTPAQRWPPPEGSTNGSRGGSAAGASRSPRLGPLTPTADVLAALLWTRASTTIGAFPASR